MAGEDVFDNERPNQTFIAQGLVQAIPSGLD